MSVVPRRIRAFLDTSALVAGIWSEQGEARLILRLGEAAMIQITVDSYVLTETQNVLQRKEPRMLGRLALLLHESRIEVVPAPSLESAYESLNLVGYAPDSQVLSAAWAARIDYFVTLDKKHFLENASLRQAVPFVIGTPGDFLAWFRAQLIIIEAEDD